MDFRHQSNHSSPHREAPDGARDWTVADLIDFEYYLDADERELREQASARKVLAERDRALYLEDIAPEVADHQPHTPTHRRISLRRWLAARRGAEPPEMRGILPGSAFASAQRLVVILLAVVGFLGGIGVASALLSYDGTRPVSVSWYLFLLVIVQFLLVVSVAAAWGLRRARGQSDAAPGLMMHVVRPLVAKAASWLQSQRIGHAATDVQDQVRARQGLLKSQYALYGPVSYLPLLIPVQVFGVAFNVGVILTTLLLEWFTDLAFGWGSTLNVHPQTIFDMTRLIALPWGWLLGEGIGYPSLEQVAGSRIILEHWATATPTVKPDPAHLRSWGSFLVLAVFTYGLLPRLALWGGSVLAQRFILARLPFTHSRTQALYARMLLPRLETTARGGREGAEMPIPAPSVSRNLRPGVEEPATQATARPWRNALVKPVQPDAAPPRASSEPALERSEPTETAALVGMPGVEAMGPSPAPSPEPGPPETETHRTASEEPESPVAEGAVETLQPIEAARKRVRSAPKRKPEAELVPEPKPDPEPASESEPKPKAAPAPEPRREAAPVAQALPPSPESTLILPPEPKRKALEPKVPEPEAANTAPPALPPQGPEVEQTAPIEPAPVHSERASTETLPVAPRAPEKPVAAPPIAPAAEPEPVPGPVSPSGPTPPQTLGPRGVRFDADACLLLLHVDIDDILEAEDRPRLEQLLMEHTGWRVAATETVGAGSSMTEAAIAVLENGDWQAPPPRIVVIEDGSQPPITESLRFLRELRAAAGTRAQIMLALVGDPTDEDRLPPMRLFDFTDWQRKIDQMADPYLRLEILAPPDEDGDD